MAFFKKTFKTPKANRVKKKSPLFIVLFAILALYVVMLFTPMFWGAMNSLKDEFDYTIDALSFPWPLAFYNYSIVWQFFKIDDTGFFMMLVNSILYAVGSAVLQTVVTFIVAYAAARFKFFIGKVLYGIVIVGMILPIVGAQPSMLAIARQLGLYDNFPGMFLQKANFMGMYFLVFHATLSAFPKDYEEAAEIDGAGHLTILFRIMWPLSITTFSTILLLYFIKDWNDYTTPMLFLPSHPTLAYGLHYFDSLNSMTIPEMAHIDLTMPPYKLAACVVVAIPTLILFMIFHDRLLNNVSIGGVKE